MADQYLSDKLRGLFKMVVWSARPKDHKQKDMAFAAAMKHIEDAGRITDPEVIRVLDAYAQEFKDVGLTDEADRLASLANSSRQLLPNLFSAEGRELEWWEQPEFANHVPEFPWAIKASRVQPGPGGGLGGFLCVCFALFLLFGLVYSMAIEPIFKALRLDDGTGALIFMLSLPAGAWSLYRWRDSRLAQKGRESWCTLTTEGIEFNEPGNSGKIEWSEIKNIRSDSDSSPDEDHSYDVTEIVGTNNRKIRISAQFYSDQEVKRVYGICQLQHKQQASNPFNRNR